MAAAVAACGAKPAYERRIGGAPVAVAFDVDGRVVVSDAAYRLRVFDQPLGREVLTIHWADDPGDGSVAFGASLAAGQRLMAAGALWPSHLGEGGEARLTVWGPFGEVRHVLRAPSVLALGPLFLLPEGRLLAVVELPRPGAGGAHQTALCVWDLGAGGEARVFVVPGVPGPVRDVDVDPSGTHVAFLADDGVWVAGLGRDGPTPARAVPLGAPPGDAVALAPDGVTVAAGREDGVVVCAPGAPPRLVSPRAATALRFAPAGTLRLALLGKNARLRVVDAASGAARTIAAGTKVHAFAWRGDGAALAVLDGGARAAVFLTP